MAKRKPSVFLVGGFETSSGKPEVSFGSNLNDPRNTKVFRNVAEAKRFAQKKLSRPKTQNTLEIKLFPWIIDQKVPKFSSAAFGRSVFLNDCSGSAFGRQNNSISQNHRPSFFLCAQKKGGSYSQFWIFNFRKR